MLRSWTLAIGLVWGLSTSSRSDDVKPADHQAGGPLIRSERSGRWSEPATWQGGKVPGAGARVQVRMGHTVTYDTSSDQVIRSIHVAGRFLPAPGGSFTLRWQARVPHGRWQWIGATNEQTVVRPNGTFKGSWTPGAAIDPRVQYRLVLTPNAAPYSTSV